MTVVQAFGVDTVSFVPCFMEKSEHAFGMFWSFNLVRNLDDSIDEPQLKDFSYAETI